MKISISSLKFSGRDSALEIPASRLDRMRQSFQRRLSDELAAVFHRACEQRDYRTASCLYAVLEDMTSHPRRGTGLERRISDETLVEARKALKICQAMAQQGGPVTD